MQGPPAPKVNPKHAQVEYVESVTQRLYELEMKARIGVALMNTVDAPAGARLEFGVFNPRGIKDPKVGEMVRDFEANGQDPVRQSLHVMIDPSWVDETKLSRTTDVSLNDLPTVVWNELAIKGQVIHILSGHHRTEASKKVRELRLAERKKVAAVLAKMEEASGESEERAANIASTREHLALLDRGIKAIVMWKVIFVHRGKCIRNVWRHFGADSRVDVQTRFRRLLGNIYRRTRAGRRIARRLRRR